jgi:hypothetical protein
MPISRINTNSIANNSINASDLLDASITAAKIISVANTQITGTLSVANTAITGNIISSQIAPSITLTTPALGTPSALVLTNATGLPQAGLGTNVVGNGPAFYAYQSSSTSIINVTATKVLFGTESFDTNNNFASSRFTPTVAGYYQISASVSLNITGEAITQLYTNTSTQVAFGFGRGISGILPCVGSLSKLLYFNGSTDYVEVFSYQNTGGTITTETNPAGTWFTGVLVRAA